MKEGRWSRERERLREIERGRRERRGEGERIKEKKVTSQLPKQQKVRRQIRQNIH